MSNELAIDRLQKLMLDRGIVTEKGNSDHTCEMPGAEGKAYTTLAVGEVFKEDEPVNLDALEDKFFEVLVDFLDKQPHALRLYWRVPPEMRRDLDFVTSSTLARIRCRVATDSPVKVESNEGHAVPFGGSISARIIPEPEPVNREAVTLTDGSPVTDDYAEIKENGQQKGYVVLSDEERSKGFVRPVREAYLHTGSNPSMDGCVLIKPDKNGCGTRTVMARSIAETYARDPKFYSGTFCCDCNSHFPVEQFVWEGTSEKVGT